MTDYGEEFLEDVGNEFRKNLQKVFGGRYRMLHAEWQFTGGPTTDIAEATVIGAGEKYDDEEIGKIKFTVVESIRNHNVELSPGKIIEIIDFSKPIIKMDDKNEMKEKKNAPSKMTLEEKKQQELIELVKLSKKLQEEKEKDGRL